MPRRGTNVHPSMMPLTPLTAAPADGESVAEEQHASASTSEPGSAADGEQPTAESAATPPDETAGQVETASAATDRVVPGGRTAHPRLDRLRCGPRGLPLLLGEPAAGLPVDLQLTGHRAEQQDERRHSDDEQRDDSCHAEQRRPDV